MAKRVTERELIEGLLLLPDIELVRMIQKIYFMPSETIEDCINLSHEVKILILDSLVKAYSAFIPKDRNES